VSAASPLGPLFDTAPDLDTGVDLAPLLEASIERVSNVRFMPAAAPDPRKTLREHLSDVDAIADTIEAFDAENLTDEARNELAAMLLDAITGTKRKIDNSTQVLAMYEHLETAALAEGARLQLRAKRFARQRERLENYLIATIEQSGLKKLDGETSAIALRICPERVVIDDENAIPPAFLRIPAPPAAVPDKTAIKQAIAAGAVVDGAHVERGMRLVRS
jgi:hypothetical protein